MQFDIEKFSKALDFFRTSFVEHWEDEKYKWQAVKQFQDNWNVNADDFYAMFEKATKKSNNLLDSRNFLPRGMILEFSKENPEKTRQMFEILFDENKSLSQRIENFKSIADELQESHNQNGSSKWKSHFQTDNAISTYLWFKFPQTYYIYKWSEYRNVAKELDCPVKFTKGHKENLENGFALYDSICNELAKDEEIQKLLRSKLTDDCYPDEALKTLTIDFGFHVSRYYNDGEWLPKEYNPGISKEKWIELINDKNAFSENSLVTFACIQNAKIATCADMAKEFGRNANFYNNGNWQTGERIHKKINCPLSEREIDGVRYWAVCCLARETKNKLWEFKIRPELQAAFDETGILDNIELYENGVDKMTNDNTQKYVDLLKKTHNLILHGAPGTGKTHLAREIAEAMGCADNEIGFVQFHPSYDYTDFVEGLRPVNDGGSGQIGFERKDGVFKKFCEKALLSTSTSNDFLKDLNDNPTIWKVSLEGTGDNPTRKDCLENGYIRIGWHEYGDVVDFSKFDGYTEYGGSNVLVAFQHKMRVGDIVLSCWSSTEIDAIGIVTGEYEYRSEGGDYPRYRAVKWLVKGIRENIVERNSGKTLTLASVYKLSIPMKDVLEIVSKYQGQNLPNPSTKNFVFIIDEINRGEMSKIFGELFFSIDPGYRGKDGLIKTQYQNLITESNVFYNGFYVPENVYIIGTMNDIDRNVESMDFAFRRRFTFKEITAKDTQEQILSGLDYSIREEAIKRMDSLNDAISKVEGLSSSYHIGGAYFLKLKDLDNDFGKLWEYHLEGLLREYLRGMENAESKLEDLEKAYNLENSASQQG